MTILTKPSSEKQGDKIPLPLALGGSGGFDDVPMLQGGMVQPSALLGSQQPHSANNSDYDTESMVFNRPHSCVRTVLFFRISVIVMMIGTLGGYTLYRMYAPSPNNMHYRALCDIPYSNLKNNSMPRLYSNPDVFELRWRSLLPHSVDEEPWGYVMDDNFFREKIELEMSDEESYAKIDVPDFKEGRRGRFVHDFKENQSAIIDTTQNRCFIMPLDRETTLPPKSLMDLMMKMNSGYYNIDTDRVRRNMRVVTPPITDLTLISERIANECYDMKVYMLENYISGVFKREIREIGESGKFAEFSGKKIVEFDLVNIADIEEFERKATK